MSNTTIFDFPSITKSKSSSTTMRALIEIVGGELRIFPVADSDGDEQAIRDALRFFVEDWRP